MEYVTQAISQAETDLIDTRRELQEARDLVKSLEQDAKTIEIELHGLRSYAQRRGLTGADLVQENSRHIGGGGEDGAEVLAIVPGLSMVEHDHLDLLLLTRSEAVTSVMRQASRPLDRNAIHEQCALAGRDDELDHISLTLSGLKRAGRVEKLGKGLWRLSGDEIPADTSPGRIREAGE